jgi:hypothetical protein
MSGGCFYVLVFSNIFLMIDLFLPYMLELDFIFFSKKHVFVVLVCFIFQQLKKRGGEM